MTNGNCSSNCACGPKSEPEPEFQIETGQSRREFMEQATTVTLGALTLTILGGCSDQTTDGAAAGGGEAAAAGVATKKVYGFLIDSNRCIGAGKCMTACRVENNVPDGYSRTWVERYVHFKDGSIQVDQVPETGYDGSEDEIDPETVEKAYFVPKLCNQCDDAPCNQVCPTHASITSPEGIELIDPELCIGCSYCVQACPYGVRFINPDSGIADKCNWCYHRIKREELPACVEACPVNARVFGRLDDPESEISKRIAETHTTVLKGHLGTDPKLYYVGIADEVI